MVNVKIIRRAFFSFTGRLIWGMAAIHIFLIPILLGSVLYFASYTLQEQFINDSRSTAGLIASTLISHDPTIDKVTTSNLIDELILSGEIVFAIIELPDSKVISSAFANNDNADFIEDFRFDQNNDEIYFIALPIYVNGIRTASTLRVGFDENPLSELLIKLTASLAIIVMAYIVINLLMMFYLGKRTTLPLKKLLHASRQIRKGYTDTHLDIESPVTDVRNLAIDLDLMRRELISQATTLKHQAMHDMLTDLPNRMLLEDRMRQAILTNDRHSQPFTLLFMDLDRFKEVNDTLGHPSGDEVLRQAAARLIGVVRKEDTVARLGGDEFAILLHGASSNASRVADNMVREMERTFTVNGHSISIGASVGIAYCLDAIVSTEELMRQADIAMYEAKNNGVRYKTYNTNFDSQALEKLVLNNDLRNAIIEDQIVLHYQPKIDLISGKVNELEALARWQHPEKGIITPDKFIPLAEKNGLIIKMTNKLLIIAINDAAKWYHTGQAVNVSLNLSPQNLLDNTLPQRIGKLLKQAKLPAKYLSLEITENAIIQEPDQARKILLELKAMGVQSIIDDFGTGYSSLVYLRHLPVNEIKIDKSFIMDMMDSEDDYHIVKAIIRMAHDLELQVTAEGIETSAVGWRLKQLRCDKGQGYYYSKALPVEKLDEWRVQYKRSQLHVIKT